MESVIIVLLLAMVFAGTHIGLATLRLRTPLIGSLGEGGFRALSCAIAGSSFAAATPYYAAHRGDGGPGLALGQVAVLRWPLIGLVVLGVVLMVASFATYSGSPYDLDDPHPERPPRGLE